MNRLLVFVATAAAALGVLAAAGEAAPSPQPPTILDNQRTCPRGSTFVLAITQHIVNDADRAPDGRIWAVDNYTRTIYVHQSGPDLYCVSSGYSGTFVSNGNGSPQTGAYLAPGVTGTISGGWKTTVFHAKLRAGAPSSATYDYVCDPFVGCDNSTDFVPQYFESVSGYGWDLWQFVYRSPANGTWQDSMALNSGDISGF